MRITTIRTANAPMGVAPKQIFSRGTTLRLLHTSKSCGNSWKASPTPSKVTHLPKRDLAKSRYAVLAGQSPPTDSCIVSSGACQIRRGNRSWGFIVELTPDRARRVSNDIGATEEDTRYRLNRRTGRGKQRPGGARRDELHSGNCPLAARRSAHLPSSRRSIGFVIRAARPVTWSSYSSGRYRSPIGTHCLITEGHYFDPFEKGFTLWGPVSSSKDDLTVLPAVFGCSYGWSSRQNPLVFKSTLNSGFLVVVETLSPMPTSHQSGMHPCCNSSISIRLCAACAYSRECPVPMQPEDLQAPVPRPPSAGCWYPLPQGWCH